jgi:hypothetical protein
VEIVDQDLLLQSSQKDARIIGGKREKASLRGNNGGVFHAQEP